MANLSVCLYICVYAYMHVYLHIYMPVFLFACLYACLYICVSICLHISLSMALAHILTYYLLPLHLHPTTSALPLLPLIHPPLLHIYAITSTIGRTVLIVDQSGSMKKSDVMGHRSRSRGVFYTIASEMIATPLLHNMLSFNDTLSLIEMRDFAGKRVIYLGLQEAHSLRGWRMSGHWVTHYEALVLLYQVIHSRYSTIPYTY